MNVANRGNPYAGTPLGELMALSFVTHELVLYLDTHGGDTEAFAVLQNMLRLKAEAHRRYSEKFGPVSADDLIAEQSFTWARTPWPWDMEGMGR
jgi:spore coat protein JB